MDDESKEGDGDMDTSEKGGDEEDDGEGDEDEPHGGKRGSGSELASVVSKTGSVAMASAPPVDPMHLHTVSLPMVMASVDILFPR